jgi:hypothetical protein
MYTENCVKNLSRMKGEKRAHAYGYHSVIRIGLRWLLSFLQLVQRQELSVRLLYQQEQDEDEG